VVARAVFLAHRLDARRIVDVGDGGDVRTRPVHPFDERQAFFIPLLGDAPLFDHVRHQQHVRRRTVEVEVLTDPLFQHARRERPEALAVLDLQVHDRLHARRARVADDRAAAQGARTELHPPLAEADDVLSGQHLRDPRRPVGVRQLDGGQVVGVQIGLDLVAGEFGAEKGALHAVARFAVLAGRHLPRLAERVVPVGERRAEGATGVARGRLDEQAVEDAGAQQDAVGDAVERDAAGHAQVALAGELAGVPRQLEDDLLGDLLDRLGQVHLARADRRLGLARRSAEQGGELVVRHHQAVEVAEVVHVEAERAVLADVHQLFLDDVVVLAFAVRREAHELVLAGVHLEAGEVGEGRVEEAQGVREGDLLHQLERIPFADADRRRRPLADAVESEHRGLLERGRVEGARRVRLVMLGEEDVRRLGEAAALQRLVDVRRNPQLLAQPDRDRLHRRAQAARRHGQIGLQDAVELEQRLVVEDHAAQIGAVGDAAFGEAVAHGVVGEPFVVLLAREALFLRRGDDPPFVDQAGRRIVVIATDAQELHRIKTAGDRTRESARGLRATSSRI